jgi:hypothetical protein
MTNSKTLKNPGRELGRLSVRYGWTAEEIDEIKREVISRPQIMERYWRNLAIARSAGFIQTQQNGFLTLRAWCAQTGRPDPTWHDLNTRFESNRHSIRCD